MKKFEKRIKELVHRRPGIRTSEIVEYLGADPSKILLTIKNMREKGMIVGKPVKGEYIGVADNMEIS